MRSVCGLLFLLVLPLPAAEPVGPKAPASGPPAIAFGRGTVVLYPVPEQSDVPTIFPGGEIPNPIPKATKLQAGYPITATFAAGMSVTGARGKLVDAQGKEVATWFSSPTEPANEKYRPHQQNTLCLYPQQPLAPGAKYTVALEATVDRAKWARTWSFTTATDTDPLEDIAVVLARMNRERTAAGVGKVELDGDLSKACQAHARYLAHNLPDRPDLKLREEIATLPGATPEGRKIATNAIVLRNLVGTGTMDFSFGVAKNRVTMLYPGLTKIGMGVAHDPAAGQLWVIEPYEHAGPIAPVLGLRYPGPGQQNVPLTYPGGKVPHPVPDPKQRDQAGFAITAIFWTPDAVRGARGTLTKRGGGAVACWLSSPEQPALPGTEQDSICLIAKQHLEPGTTYDVAMSATVGGKPWETAWSFTTASADPAAQARIEAKTLDLVNAYRTTAGLGKVQLDADLSKSCAKHAAYLRQNLRHPATDGLGMHAEDPKLPGYSAEGQKAGKGSVITLPTDPLLAVPVWMNTLYHRVPLLDPRLRKVGLAHLPVGDGRWVCVLYVKP